MRIVPLSLLLITVLSTQVEAGVRNFFAPLLDGVRVDACLSSGPCGKPAADAFCKLEGYDKAMIFQRESVAAPRKLDSGKSCVGSSCTAFKQVKCFSTKDNLAGL